MEAHQEYQEMLAPHALAALDAAEASALERHLANCPECNAELAELRDASALLAYAAEPLAPREDLRETILQSIRRTAADSNRVVPIVSRRPNRWLRSLRIAASIVLAAVVIGLLAILLSKWLVAEHEISSLTGEVEVQKSELAAEREALSKEREMVALLSSANAKKMELSGTPTAQNARAMFVFDQQTGHAMLRTEGLPATPSDKTYEIWFIPKGGAPMPGKLFTVDSKGYAIMTDQMPPEARGQVVIAITLEPKRGSAAPTGAIYLASQS